MHVPPIGERRALVAEDARYEHVRVEGRVVSPGMLVVNGMRADGQRELLAVDVADSESEASSSAG